MGEERKEFKVWFKTNDDAEYREFECVKNLEIKAISNINDNVKIEDYFMGEWGGELTIDSKDTFKSIEKLLELSPLSKKRTRKLLMSKGFDRDTAQMYADTMYPRNMNAIKELIEIAENSRI